MQRQIWPEIAIADLLVGRVRVAVQQRAGGEHHARRAEPALQPVLLVEALLHRVEHAVALEALDGRDLVVRGRRGEDRARLRRLAVHQHDARAAVRRVAAPVGAGEAEVVAQEVDEQQPRLDVAGVLLAVDGHRDLHGGIVAGRFSRVGRPPCQPADGGCRAPAAKRSAVGVT